MKERKFVMRQAKGLRIHEIANEHPWMSNEQYRDFLVDVEANGIMVPVLFWKSRVVDGRHRVRAAIECFGKDYKIECEVIPYNTTKEEVITMVNSSETRRQQTQTQLDIRTWLKHVHSGDMTKAAASKITSSSPTELGYVDKIHHAYGMDKLLELKKGNKIKVTSKSGVITKSKSLRVLARATQVVELAVMPMKHSQDEFTKKMERINLTQSEYVDSLSIDEARVLLSYVIAKDGVVQSSNNQPTSQTNIKG